jgi:hypothetical protein
MSTCEYCKSTFTTKYTLKSHLINNKACLKNRGLIMENKWQCKGCLINLTFKCHLIAHQDICKDFIKKENDEKIISIVEEYKQKNIENEQSFVIKIETIKTENKKQQEDQQFQLLQYSSIIDELKEQIKHIDLTNIEQKHIIKQHELKIIDMKYNYEKIIKDIQSQNDKLLENLQKLASQAIDKPTNTTNNVTNNIKNSFSNKYFLDTIKSEDVKMKCQNYLTEQVFLEGQRGIAQLCTDHVIKTKDKKALMLCTDVSRKKFKYIDDQGNIKEDHDARIFVQKVSKPIKDASRIVYDSILFDVKNEKENLEEDDYSRKAYLNSKELKTIDCYVQITHFDDPDNNQEFKNELAILNKNIS